jgi:D-sedoheptulose 7-phosphate isomerase
MKKREPVSRMIRAGIRESAGVVEGLAKEAGAIEAMAGLLVATLRRGGSVLTAGNGGSAAEAMHMAEELSGRYRSNRRALPGVALCSDGTALTCIANDFGYDSVFSRQVEALGRPGDMLVVFSTSGNSPCLVRAVESARRRKMRVAALLGRGGGALAGQADAELIVGSAATARIQEAHQVVLHLLLEAVEEAFGE